MNPLERTPKLMRHADRIALLQAGQIPFPVNMEVDLSNRCPLGCQDCHQAYTHVRGPLAKPADSTETTGDFLEFTLYRRIVQEFKDAGVKSVTFTGGGEPLSHPEFPLFLRTTVLHQLSCGLYTSGVGSREHLRAVPMFCNWVVISLDATTPEEYRQYKQVNAFEAATWSVCELVRLSQISECKVTVSFLLSNHNWYRFPEMYQLHKKLGSHYCQFRPLIRFDVKTPSRMVEDSQWAADFVKSIGFWALDKPDVAYSPERFLAYANWSRDYDCCAAASLSGVMTPDGRVWTCVNRRGYPESCLGDTHAEPFAAIWQRQKLWTDFERCRVACRGDEANRALVPLLKRVKDEEFV